MAADSMSPTSPPVGTPPIIPTFLEDATLHGTFFRAAKCFSGTIYEEETFAWNKSTVVFRSSLAQVISASLCTISDLLSSSSPKPLSHFAHVEQYKHLSAAVSLRASNASTLVCHRPFLLKQ